MVVNLRHFTGPWKRHCEGFTGSRGYHYVCALSLVSGELSSPTHTLLRNRLDSISAFDLAEATGPYLGQINMIKVSSFCGPTGRLWGYDFAMHDDYRDDKEGQRIDGIVDGLPVYSAQPLNEASSVLFGSNDERHFPIMPGSMVPSVSAYKHQVGPQIVFAGIGFGIPVSEERTKSAIVVMQDVGTVRELQKKTGNGQLETEKEVVDEARRLLAASVVQVAKTQRIRLQELLVHAVVRKIGEKQVGFAMSTMPFFLLAKEAVEKLSLRQLEEISIKQWYERCRDGFLFTRR